MTIETTVNKHRGALLIAIGGFLVFLYIRHKRQQAAAAAAAQAAAVAAAAQDPGTMDQATYNKQFSQPAPAYLGSPFSGYGANAPNFPPPAQSQVGSVTPSPPITFPNPAASSSDSTVGAATGGGAPSSQSTGTYPSQEQLAGVLAGRGGYALPIGPDGKPATGGPGYFVPNNMTIEQITGGAPNPNMASYQANSGFTPQQFQQIGFTLQTDPAGNQFYAAPPGSPAPNIG